MNQGMTMERILSQKEIDTLIDALNTVKEYDQADQISGDILKNQVVLTQPEIDKLIESLNSSKEGTAGLHIAEPGVKTVLSQPEIDSLVKALLTLKDYTETLDFSKEIVDEQTVLSQEEIDRLIARLLNKE